jgi:MEDS: MEthanogen/methylotroph, DcmR Sensory domain
MIAARCSVYSSLLISPASRRSCSGAGALVQRQAAMIGMHVDGCPRCRKARERIAAVKRELAAANYPPMPDLVGSEIGLALAIETAHRKLPDAASWHPGFKRERSHGVARSAAGLVQFAHLAWAYHDNDELAARAVEYAEDGVAAAQYVELVGLASTEGLRGPLRRLTSSRTVRRALESGQAGLRDTAGYYQLAGEVVDAELSVARRVAASADARAKGLKGTRIIVDCTASARTSQQRDAFARYEHLLDQQVIRQPMAALCAYNARALGRRAVAELACFQPYASPHATPFLLYAEHDAAFGLAGTLSDGSVPLFLTALRRLGQPTGSELVIEARSAAYIGQQALIALSTHAQELNVTALLRMNRPHASRIELPYPALTIAGALSRVSLAIPNKQKAASGKDLAQLEHYGSSRLPSGRTSRLRHATETSL